MPLLLVYCTSSLPLTVLSFVSTEAVIEYTDAPSVLPRAICLPEAFRYFPASRLIAAKSVAPLDRGPGAPQPGRLADRQKSSTSVAAVNATFLLILMTRCLLILHAPVRRTTRAP